MESLGDAILNVINRPYFSRAWVVHEVALARQAQVRCGSDKFPWTSFVRGIIHGLDTGFLETRILGYVHATDAEAFLAIAPHRPRVDSEDSGGALLDLRTRYRVRNATNPSDKVYSMFGLLDDTITDLGIVPDYSCSYEDVYLKTAMSILSRSGSLDILGMVGPLASSGGLPWAPNWAAPAPAVSLTIRKGQTAFFIDASRGATSELRFGGQIRILLLKGHVMDSIVETAGHLMRMDDWFDNIDGEEDVERPKRVLPPNATFIESVDSFWRDKRDDWSGAKGSLYFIHRGLRELLRSIQPLECFIELEKLARVHEPQKKDERDSDSDNMSIYWEIITASNRPPGGDEETAKASHEWYQTLAPIRKLIKVKLDALPKLYKPLAFASYVRATRQSLPNSTKCWIMPATEGWHVQQQDVWP